MFTLLPVFGVTQHISNHLCHCVYIRVDLQYKFLELGTQRSKDTWILEVNIYCHVSYQTGCKKRVGECLLHITSANTGCHQTFKTAYNFTDENGVSLSLFGLL